MTPIFTPWPKIANLDKSLIPLTNGGFAICDEEDHEKLRQYDWFHVLDGNVFYAARTGPTVGSLRRMHREVVSGPMLDHVNGDGLDNRKSNLRPATNAQNQMNRSKCAKASSKFKGVCWHKVDKIWMARIKADGRRVHLGSFRSEVDAALAYNAAATFYFGEYAKLNVLNEQPKRQEA